MSPFVKNYHLRFNLKIKVAAFSDFWSLLNVNSLETRSNKFCKHTHDEKMRSWILQGDGLSLTQDHEEGGRGVVGNKSQVEWWKPDGRTHLTHTRPHTHAHMCTNTLTLTLLYTQSLSLCVSCSITHSLTLSLCLSLPLSLIPNVPTHSLERANLSACTKCHTLWRFRHLRREKNNWSQK